MLYYVVIDKDVNKITQVMGTNCLPYDPTDVEARESYFPMSKYELLLIETEDNLLNIMLYNVQLSNGVYTVSQNNVAINNRYLNVIRQQRNQKLNQVDYTQFPHRVGTKDHTGVELTTARALLWEAYMQDLRDLPSTITDAEIWLSTPQWPEEP